MRKKYPELILLIIALLMTGAFGVMAQQSISPGETITDTAEGTVDYTLTLEANQRVTISLVSDDFDALLRLYDSTGDEVAFDDDGGEETNALLVYDIQEAGTYNVSVRAFAATPDGEYTLSVDTQDIQFEYDGGTLTDEAPVTIDTPDAEMIYVEFEASQGDVVNLLVESELDTFLTLFDPSDEEIAYDDDSNGDLNPALRRLELPVDGTYRAELTHYNDELITETVTITLEQTEKLNILNAEPVTLSNTDTITLDATAGQSYRLTLTFSLLEESEANEYNYFSVNIHQDDTPVTNINGTTAQEVSVVFETSEAGATSITITPPSGTEFTASLETVD